jgi:hypothetical protein
MAYTIMVPQQWTEQEWEDAILGSGFDTYSWWGKIEAVREGDGRISLLLIQAEDPRSDETSPVFIQWRTSLGDLATVASRIAEREPESVFARQLAQQDLDANDVDYLMQVAVYGRAVFG